MNSHLKTSAELDRGISPVAQGNLQSSPRAWQIESMSAAWIDSHSHLADPRLDQRREAMIKSARDQGIAYFLQGGVGPEDWQRQKELNQKYPEIWLCFGLHPYWIAEHNEDDCELALNQLAKEISSSQVYALGELGLDFRPHIMKESRSRQIEYFELQLELAEVSNKPIVLHLVQAYDEAQRIFQMRSLPSQRGLVHSFNGSVKQAEAYLSHDLYLSVGGPLLRADNLKLRQAVQEIPMTSLLLETDSPDQPPPELQEQYNEPQTLILVAKKVAEIKKMDFREVLDRSSQNLRKLLSI